MKDNKIIAEFMGIKTTNGIVFQDANTKEFHTIKYHTSWDWLMPVIDKCYQEHMSKHIAEAVMTCDIEEAYKSVVEFIKEYNKTTIEYMVIGSYDENGDLIN